MLSSHETKAERGSVPHVMNLNNQKRREWFHSSARNVRCNAIPFTYVSKLLQQTSVLAITTVIKPCASTRLIPDHNRVVTPHLQSTLATDAQPVLQECAGPLQRTVCALRSSHNDDAIFSLVVKAPLVDLAEEGQQALLAKQYALFGSKHVVPHKDMRKADPDITIDVGIVEEGSPQS